MLIPYGRQYIDEEDIESVVNTLRSDYLTQGPKISEFEAALSKFCGSKYGVAVNSATSALHLSCLALGLKAGDYVWTSPNSFVASANCAIYCGAEIDFVDIDPKTYNMSADELETKLISAEKEGKLPKIVIPVHFAGQPCDMQKIHNLSKKYGFYIIEDASHAIGSTYFNTKTGSCIFSDITVFSFHPVKIITTGEGGFVTTNCSDVYKKISLLRSHGVTRDFELLENKSEGSWFYEQKELGFNYRITDIQASLGISQLKKLDSFISKRRNIARIYNNSIENSLIVKPYNQKNIVSSMHLYPITLNLGALSVDRKEVFNYFIKNGVAVNVHYIPIHVQPFYKKLGFKIGDFPIAEDFYSKAISLPIFPSLKIEDQLKIIELVNKIE